MDTCRARRELTMVNDQCLILNDQCLILNGQCLIAIMNLRSQNIKILKDVQPRLQRVCRVINQA